MNVTATFSQDKDDHHSDYTPSASLTPSVQGISLDKMKETNQKLMTELGIMIDKLEEAVKKFKVRKEHDRHAQGTVAQYYGGQISDEVTQKEN